MIMNIIRDLKTAGYLLVYDTHFTNLKEKQISYLERYGNVELTCFSLKESDEVFSILNEKKYEAFHLKYLSGNPPTVTDYNISIKDS